MTAHTPRAATGPAGTTRDWPEPAPTRRSSVASAHPKPGYQRVQEELVILMPVTRRPILSCSGGRIFAK